MRDARRRRAADREATVIAGRRESDIQRAIVDALSVLPVSVQRLNSGRVRVTGGWMQLLPEGTPDLMVMMFGGRVCFIEVKRDENGVLSEDQARVHAEYAAMGHVVLVCWDPMTAVRFVNAERLRGAL
jgi:hypothetical protein